MATTKQQHLHQQQQTLLFPDDEMLATSQNNNKNKPDGDVEPPQHHVIFVGDPAIHGSKMRLVVTPSMLEVSSSRRSTQYWCVRFLLLVFLVSMLQLTVILLFPSLHQFFLTWTTKPESASRQQQQNTAAAAAATELKDLFLAVKSTKRFHETRLNLLLDTWIDQVKEQTFIFTDSDDESVSSRLPDSHFVVTDCAAQHSREALACKMAREFAGFYKQAAAKSPRWFCHFDDDTYVSYRNLLKLLNSYDPAGDWYLGRPSLEKPMRLPAKPESSALFNFATGGAGFCISQSLMTKLEPLVVDGQFERTSADIRLPDDCTVGYLVEVLLGKKLSVIYEMHSHLEFLAQAVTDDTLDQQITFSYSKLIDRQTTDGKTLVKVYDNVIGISSQKFSPEQDPTRLLSSHCALFPSLRICQK